MCQFIKKSRRLRLEEAQPGSLQTADPTSMTKTSHEPKSFESAVSELEAIVGAMESPELPLEQALSQYERGVRLLQYCEKTLEGAEQKLRVLEGEQLTSFADEEAER